MRTLALLLAATAVVTPCVAMAQAADDVIVMRRPFARAQRTPGTPANAPTPSPTTPTPGVTPTPTDMDYPHPTPTPTPAARGVWAEGDWTWAPGTPGCTTTATRTRTVSCVDARGDALDRARCDGARDEVETQVVDRDDGCAYRWEEGAWSDEGACARDSAGTRAVVCRRSDETAAADAHCGEGRPVSTRRADRLEGCSFAWVESEWSDWTPGCTASATRSRTVQCQAGTGPTAFATDDERCSGDRPGTAEGPAAWYGGCTGGWTYRTWKVKIDSCQHGRRLEALNADCIRPDGDVDTAATTCDPTVRPIEQQRFANCTVQGEALLSATTNYFVDAAHPLVNGDIKLTISADGRPTVVRISDGSTIWIAAPEMMFPGYAPGGILYMQSDGNLVLYNPSGAGGGATFHTNSWGAIAAYTVLTAAGTIEVRHPDTGQVLWRSVGASGAEGHWDPFQGRYVP